LNGQFVSLEIGMTQPDKDCQGANALYYILFNLIGLP
jgi:hypothetical protein